MKSGRLALTVHGATLDLGPHHAPGDASQLYAIAEIGSFGRLKTGEGAAKGEGSISCRWEEELTFHLGPGPGVLKLVVYAVKSGANAFLAEGCLNLEHIEEAGKQEKICLPLVGDEGRHVGDALLTARYFHSRTPGKGRDELGRDGVTDAELLTRGPCEAAKQLNERSPNSPRSGSPAAASPRQAAVQGECQ